MEPKTRDHLATAERNRIVAGALIGEPDVQTISNEWAVVIAFYAAVHLVNAILWERQSLEPLNHEERSRFVFRLAELRPIAQVYPRLSVNAYHARYTPEYRISAQRARQLASMDLSLIESTILISLNRP